MIWYWKKQTLEVGQVNILRNGEPCSDVTQTTRIGWQWEASMKGSGFSMHSATKFKCNFVVIDVVHSGIKMTGSYFSEFRWDEKCFNSLHKYKDYPKTHPLPQYAQMINFVPVTQCSPKWYCDACCTARVWRKWMAQRCPVNRQHRVFFYVGSLGILRYGWLWN